MGCRAWTCWTLVAVGASGCSPADEQSPEAPRPTPEWTLIGDLRLGSLGAADDETFGSLPEMAALSTGGVLLLDGLGRRVVLFSEDGELRSELGARGSGPGEFQDVSGLAVIGDTTFLVRDSRRGVMFFDAAGHLREEWSVYVDYVGSDPLTVVGGDVLLRYVASPVALETFWEAPLFDFVRVSSDGSIDTLGLEVSAAPGTYWAAHHAEYHSMWLSSGALVDGSGAEGILKIRNGEQTTDFELASLPRVPLPASLVEESRVHKQQLEERGNRTAEHLPDPPEFLPVFEDLLISDVDEIWVLRPNVAEDGSLATRADIYAATGAPVAVAHLPSGFTPRSIAGSWIWGVVTGEFDEPYAVRLRIER